MNNIHTCTDTADIEIGMKIDRPSPLTTEIVTRTTPAQPRAPYEWIALDSLFNVTIAYTIYRII